MQKLVLATLSTLTALILAWFVVRAVDERRAARGGVRVVDTTEEMQDALERAALEGAAPGAVESEAELPPLVHLRPLPMDVRAAFYPEVAWPDVPRGIPDELTYIGTPPGYSSVRAFPAHPDGKLETVFNALALKHPTEVQTNVDGIRILVTGDSHVEGVVPFREEIPQLLAEGVAGRLGAPAVEGLNAGRGAFTIYNYLGVLEKYAFLDPDVFVVVVYGGNDFSLVARMERYFNGRGRFHLRKWKGDALASWKEVGRIRPQEANQMWYFHFNPDDEAYAARESAAILDEIVTRCRLRGIHPVLAYLPPPLAMQPGPFEAELDAIARTFGVERGEALDHLVGVSDRIADETTRCLAALGHSWVDLRPLFRDAEEPLYWPADCHINTEGSRITAEAILPLVEAGLRGAGRLSPVQDR